VVEIKQQPLLLIPGWVTTRVHSGKNLAITQTRVANQQYQPYQPYTAPTLSTVTIITSPTIDNDHNCRALDFRI